MVHYRFKPEDNHNDPKCSENETNRKNILANIKRQAEKIWEDYKKINEVEISKADFYRDKLGIAESSIRNITKSDNTTQSISEKNLVPYYKLHIWSGMEKEKFISMFDDEETVRKYINKIEVEPLEDLIKEKSDGIKLENAEKPLDEKNTYKTASGEIEQYVKDVITGDCDINLKREESAYKKYEIEWTKKHPFFMPKMKYLFIVPVIDNNVQEIVEKKNRTKENSIIWFIYMKKNEAFQKGIQMYLKGCKFPEECILFASTLGDYNLDVLYNPEDTIVENFIKDKISINNILNVRKKYKKDGKKKKTERINLFDVL